MIIKPLHMKKFLYLIFFAAFAELCSAQIQTDTLAIQDFEVAPAYQHGHSPVLWFTTADIQVQRLHHRTARLVLAAHRHGNLH